MKKKNLKSLHSIEKWLNTVSLVDSSLESAFNLIRERIEAVEEIPSQGEATDLPSPVEIQDEPETLALFSDGGCRGNPGPGAYAYLIQRHDGEVVAEGVDYESFTTNNKMELSAPLRGLNELLFVLPIKNKDPLLTKVKVITDSKYVVDGMKSWVQGWKGRDWKKADGKAPENMDLWKELDAAREKFMQVEWVWVRGHSGHPQNEYCDRKANEVMDANSPL